VPLSRYGNGPEAICEVGQVAVACPRLVSLAAAQVPRQARDESIVDRWCRLAGMVDAMAVAVPVVASAIVDELLALRISHVVNVPDTHQRTLLAELARQDRIQVLTACTEDEAVAISAGLWVGGQRPVLSIQHVGLLAALNNIKGIAMEARIPTCMLVGYFGRDVTRAARENVSRAVNLIEPTLDTWGIPYFPLETPEDLHTIREAYETSQERQGPSVVLIGAPTS
jgi:sulfopyruvate decarboxylase TPP-binding subunit